MALREIAGLKWGLVVQRGPFTETATDKARASLTTGKPNAGHGNAYETISPAYDPHYIPAPPGPSRYAQRSIVNPSFNQVGATGILKAPMNELVAAIDNHISLGIATPAEMLIRAQIQQIEENEAKAEIDEDLFQNSFYKKEDVIEEQDVDMNAEAQYFIYQQDVEPEQQALVVSNYIPPSENFYGQTLDVVGKIPVFIPPHLSFMPGKPVEKRPVEYPVQTTRKRKGSQSNKPNKNRKPNPEIVGEEVQGVMTEIPIKNVNVSTNAPMTSTTDTPVKIPKIKYGRKRVPPNPRITEESRKRKMSEQGGVKKKQKTEGANKRKATFELGPKKQKFAKKESLKINTNVPKVKGPQVQKKNITKKMNDMIPDKSKVRKNKK